MKTCNLNLPQAREKKVSKLRMLMQKFRSTPILNARIRYDINMGKWALLDEKNEPLQHFIIGVMQNVSFSSATKKESVGCSGSTSTMIGIATGDLYLHKVSDNLTGSVPLSFNSQGQFLAGDKVITRAYEVVLMAGRHAHVKP